jgi:rod shape determining protein RodA
MRRWFFGFDWSLFLPIIILLVFGLLLIHNLTPALFWPQLINVLIGLAFFFLFQKIDYRIFERLDRFIFASANLFLVSTFIFGTLTRGVMRWISFGPFTLQPSELVKPFLIVFFSVFLARRELNSRSFFIVSFLFLIPLALIFFQPDLGSSFLFLAAWLAILVAAGVPLKTFLLGFLVFALLIPLTGKFLFKSYQYSRLISFLNPEKDPLGAGYNLIQATVAVGSGQLLGRGWGQGTQSHLRFLPEHQTDFIFASLAEELGFVGCLVVLLVFAALLWRILRVVKEIEDPLAILICIGSFGLLFTQILVNVGMNIGLLPITGITLPLISYGGSSLVSTMICLGLVASISSLNKKTKGTIIHSYV